MNQGAAANLESLRTVLRELDEKTGELAEVRKAELQAWNDGYQGSTVTEARERAKSASLPYTKEAIDLQCDIDSMLRWKSFYEIKILEGLD